MDYYELAEAELEDEELVPELLPVDARLSIRTLAPILISLFERAVAVTPAKEVIPNTGYAKFEAFASDISSVPYVQLTATDGERSLVVMAEGVQVAMAGEVLLPPKRVLSILKLVSTEMVRMEVIGNSCTIRSGRAQWTVQVPGGTDIIPLPDTSNTSLVGVNTKAFLDALNVARKAAATNTARSALMQIRIRSGALTGCDGARIHKKTVPGLSTELDASIALNTADELMKALRNSHSETFEMGISHNLTAFRIDSDVLIGQRLNLPFPDVDSLLYGPFMSNTDTVVVNTAALADAVRHVRVSADPDFAGIFLAIVPGKKRDDGAMSWNVSVRARDKIGNSASETVPCTWDGAKARELCINHHSLLDLLDVFSEEEISLKLGEDTKQRRSSVYVQTEDFQASLAQMTVLK